MRGMELQQPRAVARRRLGEEHDDVACGEAQPQLFIDAGNQPAAAPVDEDRALETREKP